MPVSTVSNPPLSGLALPALRTFGGYFSTKTKYDVAWSDLMIALFCPLGGKPMNRNFGSALHDILFDPIGTAQANVTDMVIKRTAGLWCPHIFIRSVRSQVEGRTLRLLIEFGLTSDRAYTETRPVKLDRSNVIKLVQAV